MWPLELCFYYMENCYPSPGLLFLLDFLWLILASCDQSASQLDPTLLKRSTVLPFGIRQCSAKLVELICCGSYQPGPVCTIALDCYFFFIFPPFAFQFFTVCDQISHHLKLQNKGNLEIYCECSVLRQNDIPYFVDIHWKPSLFWTEMAEEWIGEWQQMGLGNRDWKERREGKLASRI